MIACSYFAQYFGLDPHAPSSYFAQTMIWSGLWIHMQYRHFCRVDNLCVSKKEAIIIIIRSVLYPPIFCVLLVCEIKNTQNVQKEEIVTFFIAHLIFPGVEGFE